MRKIFAALVLLMSAACLLAQSAKRSVPSADTECGPIGCITPEASHQTGISSGSPVVIRSGKEEAGHSTESSAAEPALRKDMNPVAAPASPTEFEQFVQDLVGHALPVFGSRLFENGGGNFAPSTNAAPPANYILGTGDEVLIRTWGKIDIDARAIVDRNGQIFLPRVGMLTVAGLRLDQLSDFIHGAISHQFTGFEISVSLGQLRSIQIFVLGHARAPGVYTISSLSTLVNALFLSGGPSSTGTLRDIQVKRDGVVITHFDVYRLLLFGNKSEDIRLLPGDVIYIPVLGAQVALDGSVGTPGIYECKSETTVADAIADAGGLTPTAGTARAMLEHVLDHSRRSMEEFPLDPKGLATLLHTGDVLRILPISPQIVDAVTLRGNVAEPGRYAWHAGMRVSDLIPNREFLLTRGYYNRRNALDVSRETHPFGVEPADPSPPPIANHDTEINWNYAAIERLDPNDLTTRLIPFALGDAISTPSSPENKSLQAGDVIVVYSQNDVALPLELQVKFVRIDGQVKAPGTYRVGQDETLRELVLRAGGIVPHAYLYAARLTRESVRVEQVAKLHTLVEEESREVLSPALIRQSSSTSGAPTGGDLELRKAYIAELDKVVPDGRVVLQLHPDAMTPQDVPDLLLEDGDHFFVPTTPNTIEVLGNVYNQGALRYLGQVHAREYLNAAGGATREGDRKREFIIRADGTVISRQAVKHLEQLSMFPGDSVVVPPRLRPGYSALDLVSLTPIFSALILGVVAIESLR